MKALYYLAIICIFMACSCMSCDDEHNITLRNASAETILVKMHCDFNDSLPSSFDKIPPGETCVIADMYIFGNDRVAYLSIYAAPDEESDQNPAASSEPTRPGSNINSDNRPPTYHLLERKSYSRRHIESIDYKLTYTPQYTEP